MVLSIAIAKPVLQFIKAPIESALKEFKQKRVEQIGNNLDDKSDAAIQKANEPRLLTYFVRPGISLAFL